MEPMQETDKFAALRQLAEDVLHGLPIDLKGFSSEDKQFVMQALESQQEHIGRLIHELQVHQVELDIQNDELRKTQEKLQLSHQKYADLYDFAPVGYFTIDQHARIVEVNLAGSTLLRIERSRLVQRHFTEFIVPDDRDAYYFHRKHLDTEHISDACEIRLLRNDGSHFHARLESSLVAQLEEAPYYRTVVVDITKRVQAEEALRRAHSELEQRVQKRTLELARANEALQGEIGERRRAEEAERQARLLAEDAIQARDHIFRMVSHDLRAPLTVIQGHAHLMHRRIESMGIPDSEWLMQGLEGIEQATSRISAQVQELLDVAMLQAGQPLSLNYQSLDLVHLVQRVVDSIQHIGTSHSMQLHTNTDSLVCAGDEMRLERVFHNLLTNAIKYSPDESTITICIEEQTSANQSYAIISVSDQGIGIPAEDLLRIFEPFVRARNTTGRIEGTGMGLASVRQIVERHGGTVEAVSTEGNGSTFTVQLPLE